MDLFESARLRVERARIHASEMTAVWNEFLEPHPFSFDLVRESDTAYLLRCELHTPLPGLLSALFGEWLYNLRSALDYIVGRRQLTPPGRCLHQMRPGCSIRSTTTSQHGSGIAGG